MGKKELTTAEIHLLAILLTGELNEHNNVRVARMTKSSAEFDGGYYRVDLVFTCPYPSKLAERRLAREIIPHLVALNLIRLKPPSKDIKHFCEGEWTINKKVFKRHPQYNEVRAQAALGT